MDNQEIKQLLERYWNCETSLEEEQKLIAFFSENEFSQEMKIYRPLFTLIDKQLQLKASKKLTKSISKPLKLHFYPAMKVAASVLILLTVGIGFYTHYQQEKQMERIFTGTCADPEDAVKETARVIAKVSSVLQLIEEKSIWNGTLDSIRLKKKNLLHEESIKIPE
jgi:hypothetical protein